MQNVNIENTGDELVIRVDLKAKPTMSKSGKSNILATSSGNQDVPGLAGAKIGLNIYSPRA